MSDLAKTGLSDYYTDYSNDELFTTAEKIKPCWDILLTKFGSLGDGGLATRQKEIDWLLAENGVTYNVYNDPKGLHRPWNLNVVPYILTHEEWRKVSAGIEQRATLLDLILKDIYGAGTLVKKGILPYEIIYGHSRFLRQCTSIEYTTKRFLSIYAADVARGSDGRLWIVNDRTEAPSGMGYSLENRATSKRILPAIHSEMNVTRLGGFFKKFNQMLLAAAPRNKEQPTIVVLTPGSHNETYFEHAYLASFFGYRLVQGNDLVVRNGFLWMKSLKGLKQVDVVLRRVDGAFVDPLELREDSYLGVAGLLEVVRRKNVAIVNPIGSGVMENPGIIPFMPAIAKHFLNEELLLPQIASWWCGQEKERKYVLEYLSKLVIKRIDKTNRESIQFGEFLSTKELDHLKMEINASPYKFVAQERINFSTAPNFNKNVFEPRNVVTRTFCIASDSGYDVMPGGLVRVAPSMETIRVSNQRGGISKDFWILNEKPIKDIPIVESRQTATIISGLDDLPSMTAENLFWAGRYVGRTLVCARYIRTVMRQMLLDYDKKTQVDSIKLKLLFKTVTHLTGTYPGFSDEKGADAKAMEDPMKEMLSVLFDKQRAGSLSHTLEMFTNAYYTIRNLWSSDMWRVFDTIQKIWRTIEESEDKSIQKIIKALNQLITRLIAFMGLIEESIMVQQGLLLYFIGLQLEQSAMTITKCQSLLSIKYEEHTEYELLEYLLTSHESLNIYRYSYRARIQIENVIDLLLLNVAYPRSLAFMVSRLQKDINRLPHSKDNNHLTAYQKFVFEAYSKLRLAEAKNLTKTPSLKDTRRNTLIELLEVLSDLLHQTSRAVTSTYFNHTDKQSQLVQQNFPI